MQAYLETIVCEFGRDPAICLREEAICAKCLQTDRQTDDGRTPRDCISSWNELMMRSVGKHCTEWLYGMQQAGGK